MAQPLKVSVCMITYNHEKFIAQAIESVLMQEVNFDYEIVIGEDCSTDGTREIVKKYAEKYPDKIRVLFHSHNLGLLGKNNFVQTFKACQGQYVALLEGDDYWIDPLKLQKQANLLDEHPQFAICFHRIVVAVQECNEYKIVRSSDDDFLEKSNKSFFTIEDLLDLNFIPAVSALFRNKLFKEFPTWIYDISWLDWALHILNAQHGDIAYIDRVMAAYRVHAGGVFTEMERKKRYIENIKLWEFVNKHLNYKYDKLLRARISDACYRVVDIALAEKDIKLMRKYIIKGLYSNPFNRNVTLEYLLKSIIISIFPLSQKIKGILNRLW